MNTFTKKMTPFLMAIIAIMYFNFTGVAQNMITNPGFENWTDGKPDGWFGERSNIVAANVVQYTANVHGGSSACQLINETSDNRRLTSKAVSVVNGQTYTIKLWVRGHGDCRSGLWDGQGTGGDNYIYDSQVINVNSDTWAQQTFTVTAPVTADNAEFIILVRNTNGDKDHLQFDDVEVTGGGTVSLAADFKVDRTTAEVDATIYFTDLSAGNPVAWEWTVSGPVTMQSAEQNPSFKFTVAGTYDVTLIVSDEESSDKLTKVDYIVIGDYIFFQDWNIKEDWKGWTKINITGTQEWKFTDRYGIDDSPCIQMSGHDGTSPIDNEDWLISPEFQLASGNKAILNFYNAYKYPGNPLKLYFSNDYMDNVATATWSELTYTMSTGEFAWVNSGDILLSDFSGDKCHIAFKYTSTGEASSSWELDNISLQSSTVSIPNVGKQISKAYPNPSSTGVFTITTTGNADIKAFSIDGRLIKQQTMANETTFDLSTCTQGIYFLQIIQENGLVTTQKVVIK